MLLKLADKGPVSGFQDPLQKFVSTDKEWIELWMTRQSNLTPKKRHPANDSDKKAVVLAGLGTRNTVGSTIEITKIVRTADDIQIVLRRTSPPEGVKVTVAVRPRASA